MNKYITNTLYREALRCRRLFFYDYKTDECPKPFPPELTRLAEGFIEGGIKTEGENPTELAESTMLLLKNGTKIIKHPVFPIDGAYAEADILYINKNGESVLYFSHPALHIRHVFYKEAAFIYAGAEKSGLKSIRIFLLTPKKSFIKNGEINPREFFASTEITSDAAFLRDKAYILSRVICEIAECKNPPEEDLRNGCFAPETCKYFERCTAHLPKPNIFKISRLSLNTKLQFYREGKYSYESVADDKRLTEGQRRQVKMSLSNSPPLTKKKELAEFINSLWYPLCFLDFESWQPPVPPSDGMCAFEQVAFQYSLHIIEKEGGEITHREFLASGEADPREALCAQLANDIPDGACVLAYNKQFETMIVSSLAALFPDKREKMEKIRENIRDLMLPFQKKYYYDRRMDGSYSMKSVLPALYPDDPELSYANLNGIHNGSEAMLSYAELSSCGEEKAKEIRASLLKYCALDTLGMVKILEKLKDAIK